MKIKIYVAEPLPLLPCAKRLSLKLKIQKNGKRLQYKCKIGVLPARVPDSLSYYVLLLFIVYYYIVMRNNKSRKIVSGTRARVRGYVPKTMNRVLSKTTESIFCFRARTV